MANSGCFNVATGPRILSLITLVFATIVVITSALVLKELAEGRQSTAFKVLSDVANAADSLLNFFGADKIELDKKIQILLASSVTGLAVGIVQLLSNFLFLNGTGSNSRAILSFVSAFGFLAILGSLVYMFYKNVVDFEKLDKLPDKMKYWIWALIADTVLLLYCNCVGCYRRCFFENDIETADGYAATSRVYYREVKKI